MPFTWRNAPYLVYGTPVGVSRTFDAALDEWASGERLAATALSTALSYEEGPEQDRWLAEAVRQEALCNRGQALALQIANRWAQGSNPRQ